MGTVRRAISSKRGGGVCGRVHGDDFAFVRHDKHLTNIANHIGNQSKVKAAITGHRDMNELRVLNMRATWATHGIEDESDYRHAGRLIGEAVVTTTGCDAGDLRIGEGVKSLKSENGATDADGDPSLFGVGQLVAGQRTTSPFGFGQPSTGRSETPQRRR